MSRSDLNFKNANTVSSGAMMAYTLAGPGGNATLLGAGHQNYNSNIAESEMDIEFGYCSEEESIFQSFCQDVERTLPKIKKHFTMKEDAKGQKV